MGNLPFAAVGLGPILGEEGRVSGSSGSRSWKRNGRRSRNWSVCGSYDGAAVHVDIAVIHRRTLTRICRIGARRSRDDRALVPHSNVPDPTSFTRSH